VLRKIFGPKRDEVTGEWRRLHNKELYALYSSPYIIWVIKTTEMGRACSSYVGGERCVHGLVVRPEGRKALRRPRRRWDNIKMDLREVGWEGMDWIDLAQDRDRLL
jgi:hypothetical protein